MKNREKRLLTNTLILSVGTLCTKGMMFFMAPLFTRWLTSYEYGEFDLLVSYISLLLPILTLSSGEAIFRFLLDADNLNEKNKWLSTALFIYFLSMIIAGVSTVVIIKITYIDSFLAIAFLSYFCAEIMYNFCMSVMRGLKKLQYYTLGNIVSVLTMSLAVFLCVKKFSWGLPGILMGYAIGDITAVFIMLFLSQIFMNIHFSAISIDAIKEIILYAVPMIPNAISWWIISVFDRSLVSSILGTNINGIYAIANKIPNLCQTFFSIFHLSWQQSATEAANDQDRDIYYSGIFNELIKGVISICIIVLSFNYWFFKILFNVEYFTGYYHAPILVFSLIFLLGSQFLGGIYVAQKESWKNGRTTIFGALTDIIFNAVLIRTIGLYAASLSTLLSYFVLFIIRWIDIQKNFKITININSYIYIIIFLYFFCSQYAVNIFLNIINIPLALIFFLVINKKMVISMLKKIHK